MSTSIQKAFSQATSFQELYALIEQAEPHISSSGTRYISISGYKGRLPIDDLVQQVKNQILTYLPPKKELTPDDQKTGRTIAYMIDEFYQKTDPEYRDCNHLKEGVCKICDWWIQYNCIGTNSPRSDWRSEDHTIFDDWMDRNKLRERFCYPPI